MFTKAFWIGAADRAVKTGSQFLVGFWFIDQANIVGVLNLDLVGGVSIFASGVILSILTSLISAPFGDKGSAQILR